MRILFRLMAVFGLMMSLSACYVTTGNIIPAERAEVLPGLEGNWTTVEGEATDVATIAQVSGTNDYQMTSTAPDAQGQVLLMRGFKLAGDTLLPGDVIMTGTPEGVGYAMQPPQTMKTGDVMDLTIEGIGTLTNAIGD